MDIWEWASAVYARPGVEAACLRLQDEHGQNVAYLLWAVWAGTEDAAVLGAGAELARAWDAAALLPLRQARRGLKADLPPVDAAARQALRDDVKAAELMAERILLEALAGLSPTRVGEIPIAALEAASAAWGRPAPRYVLAELAAALG